MERKCDVCGKLLMVVSDYTGAKQRCEREPIRVLLSNGLYVWAWYPHQCEREELEDLCDATGGGTGVGKGTL